MLLKLRYAGQRRSDADCPDAFICQGLYYVSAVVARRAHNPEVVGSNPTPATKTKTGGAATLPFIFRINNRDGICY